MDESEEISEIINSLMEAHFVNNGDGTTTYTFILGIEEKRVYTAVFPYTLGEMFGEAAFTAVLSDKSENQFHSGVIIPNSPEEAE